MNTIDLNEYLAYVPCPTLYLKWISEQKSRDMPIEDFIQVAIDGCISQVHAIGFLIERGALTEDQMVSLAVSMDHMMPGNEYAPLRLSDVFCGDRIPELEEVDSERKEWRDLRPRSPFASTQIALFNFALKMILKSEYTRIIEAPMFSNMAFLQLTERLLGEGSAKELSKAFQHFRWVVDANKITTLLDSLIDTIKNTPVEFRTDYEATLN